MWFSDSKFSTGSVRNWKIVLIILFLLALAALVWSLVQTNGVWVELQNNWVFWVGAAFTVLIAIALMWISAAEGKKAQFVPNPNAAVEMQQMQQTRY